MEHATRTARHAPNAHNEHWVVADNCLPPSNFICLICCNSQMTIVIYVDFFFLFGKLLQMDFFKKKNYKVQLIIIIFTIAINFFKTLIIN